MKKSLIIILFLLTAFKLFAQQNKYVSDYIAKYKSLALQEMKSYKIPASITLAQGILESACGKSELARNANNHFGIKCKVEWTGEKYYYDDDEKHECFRKYKSDIDSYHDHSLFLAKREYYKSLFLLDICDYKGWAYGLKKAGYATEPMYAEMLIKIIEENQLNLLDCQGLASKTDTIRMTQVKPNTTTQLTSPDTIKSHNVIKIVGSNVEDDFGDVTFMGSSRKIYINNGVKYIKARKKDSYEKIADDLGYSASDLMRYNDNKQKHPLKEGELVYIESKSKKIDKEFHTAAEGETMLAISQMYGLLLKELYARNRMKPGKEPIPGQKIWLKNTKPEK